MLPLHKLYQLDIYVYSIFLCVEHAIYHGKIMVVFVRLSILTSNYYGLYYGGLLSLAISQPVTIILAQKS